MTKPEAIIIGGGITGLAAAYEFAKAGRPAILLEPRARLGGVIETETVEGCVVERGPDSFLAAKRAGLDLIHELGLDSEVIGSNDQARVTYLVRWGQLVPMPDGLLMMVPTKLMPLVRTPLLGWQTKLRMGLEYFRRPPRGPVGDRPVADFIRDHYGQETVDYLAEPLLSGVYGGSVERLSVRSVLGRFAELEGRYGSLTRGVLAARRRALLHRKTDGNSSGALFQTLKGGLGQLTGELERRIQGKIEIRRAAAEGVERSTEGYRVRAGGEAIETAAVILVTPAWQAGRLVRGVEENLARSLEGIEYSSSMTVAIGFRQSDCGALPAGFGFLVPARERQTMVACTFVGAKFPYRVPEGTVVLRCFAGGAEQEAVLDLDDGEILKRVLGELQELLGWTAVPLFTRIARWRRSMAQYTVGHELRLGFIHNRMKELPGLYLAGNAYDGIGVPDCIRSGREAAVRALEQPSSDRA